MHGEHLHRRILNLFGEPFLCAIRMSEVPRSMNSIDYSWLSLLFLRDLGHLTTRRGTPIVCHASSFLGPIIPTHHILLEPAPIYQLFHLILQGLALICRVAMVFVKSIAFQLVPSLGVTLKISRPFEVFPSLSLIQDLGYGGVQGVYASVDTQFFISYKEVDRQYTSSLTDVKNS